MLRKKSLVIVGNGMATGRLLDDLQATGCDDWDITVIGEENQGGYNRILLSSVLAKELSSTSIITKSNAWFAENGIKFYAGERVENVDCAKRMLITDRGRQVNYDHLVLAVGSRPARIPAENQQLSGIFSFRNLADVEAIEGALGMKTDVNSCPRALVVGGGFLGLEAAYGLAQQGAKVTLVHRGEWLLNRQLDQQAGEFLQKVLQEKNIEFRLLTEVKNFIGQSELCGATLNSGEVVECQIAVIATGIIPNAELGTNMGIDTGKGIIVDELLQTSADNVSALGECVECAGVTYGLVDPIWHQSAVLAKRLAGLQASPFVNPISATKLKISGVNLFSVGEHIEKPHHRVFVYEDRGAGVYRKCVVDNDRLVGAVLFGDVSGGQGYVDLIHQQDNVADYCGHLVFGHAYYGQAA